VFKSSRWSLLNLFFFSHESILLTEDLKRERIKKVLNAFSIVIAVLVTLYIILSFIVR
jgi:hypothetical protein